MCQKLQYFILLTWTQISVLSLITASDEKGIKCVTCTSIKGLTDGCKEYGVHTLQNPDVCLTLKTKIEIMAAGSSVHQFLAHFGGRLNQSDNLIGRCRPAPEFRDQILAYVGLDSKIVETIEICGCHGNLCNRPAPVPPAPPAVRLHRKFGLDEKNETIIVPSVDVMEENDESLQCHNCFTNNWKLDDGCTPFPSRVIEPFPTICLTVNVTIAYEGETIVTVSRMGSMHPESFSGGKNLTDNCVPVPTELYPVLTKVSSNSTVHSAQVCGCTTNFCNQ